MIRARLLPALALTLSALAGPAVAQPPGERPAGPPPGGRPPEGRNLFLSPSGEPFRGPGGLETWFKGADTDHDGALSLAEFRADALRFFKVVDANGDGAIDGLENRAYETRIAPEILSAAEREDDAPQGGGPPPGGGMGGGHGDGMRKPGGHGGMSRREGAARFSLINEPQPVRGADANLDWKVTVDEWSRAAARRFALLDTGQTGRLSLGDLPRPGGMGPPPRK
ncbi:MAG TPA: hypothetical protein PLV04_04605 [Phenylobacterium sp.]|nr:hypothetical protein [Phenylobacterium sp.]HQP19477.1 hypothetical protein [Phenylobacterium sp.]